MDNTSDEYTAGNVSIPVTALLFESDLEFDITNNYTVVEGPDSATGTFYGKWVSEAGISMPRDSQFVSIAIPYDGATTTQKLTVRWWDIETQKTGTVEYDLIVRIVPPIT